MALDLGDREVPMTVRRSLRARRIALRIDEKSDGVTLVLPRSVSVQEGVAFAQSKAVWVAARLGALPPKLGFVDGGEFPFRGETRRIRHRPGARGVVWTEGGDVCVAGEAGHLARRLTDWLKREARREIEVRVREKATRLGRVAGRIRVADTRSRWGSCSSTGTLSFSWRLILAPENVLDYVVAHEVAHLAEMNHSPRFWRKVAQLTGDVEGPRGWLKRHGTRLHRIG